MKWAKAGLSVLCCSLLVVQAKFLPLREYSGYSFFDKWSYYGDVDNTTWGNVTYVDQQSARANRLTYFNSAGHAIIKVDNSTTIPAAPLVHRHSVRLTSLDTYGVGTLIIIDVVHIPYGCSVWPSFWTYGMQTEWPTSGEIDIIEAINGMNNNQIALHALPGCMKVDVAGQQTGGTIDNDCSTPKGCIVAENKRNSYGPGFATAGGGVFATQISASGIYVWFWSRPDIPENIKRADSSSDIETTPWGIPTAAFPVAGCDITKYFPPQNLVLLTSLCGVWAGVPSIYQSSCPGSCVDNIIGTGENYGNAYWEIKYIRTYSDNGIVLGTPKTTSSVASQEPSGTPRSTTEAASAKNHLPFVIANFGCLLLILVIMLN